MILRISTRQIREVMTLILFAYLWLLHRRRCWRCIMYGLDVKRQLWFMYECLNNSLTSHHMKNYNIMIDVSRKQVGPQSMQELCQLERPFKEKFSHLEYHYTSDHCCHKGDIHTYKIRHHQLVLIGKSRLAYLKPPHTYLQTLGDFTSRLGAIFKSGGTKTWKHVKGGT